MVDQDRTREREGDETLSLTVRPELKEELRRVAEQEGRSATELIRDLIDREVRRKQSRESPPAVSEEAADGFAELYLAGGAAVREDLEPFLQQGPAKWHPFVDHRFESSVPTRAQLVENGAGSFTPPSIDLEQFEIHPDVIDLVPSSVVRKHLVLPIAQIGPVLGLAQVRPFDDRGFEEVRRRTGLKIVPIRCDDEDLRLAIGSGYDLSEDTIESSAVDRRQRLTDRHRRRVQVDELPQRYRTVVIDELRRDIEREWERICSSDRPLKPLSISRPVSD